MSHLAGKGRPPRLSLAGFVARLLATDYFRSVGFTVDLFREALFTQLLEANIAPTRLTKSSLDGPMLPTREDGKIVWPSQYWRLLNIFGMLLEDVPLDDLEVESFSDHSIALLTFHQAKGLEFDHLYVGLTGREPDPSPVLQTKLFSGEAHDYFIEDGQPVTSDAEILQLATADRDREVYVALTRAKQTLTVLHAPGDNRPLMDLHRALEASFSGRRARKLPGRPSIVAREYR
jgi:ATP-dependent DNA helicase UvrD/PcrA